MATYSSKKYPAGSVTSATLADGTIVAVDLAAGAVGTSQLASTVDLSGKTVTYRSIVAGDIASNAITSAKILDAAITPAKLANSGAELGMRNRIINGAMVIDQRNAGASVTPTANQYLVDRWTIEISQASKLSFQKSTVAPAGFTNSMKITSLSAYSITSGDYFVFEQRIEGFNVADLNWGSVDAATVTLSFKVYSSLTGTFGGALQNSSSTRSYPFTYTISSANTWTTISITVAGDTSGTWDTTTGRGIFVFFGLGVGSTYSGTAGAWAGANYQSATSTTSVVGTNGATFYITGVQLEVGTVATSFDFRSIGTELALCQRYFTFTTGDTQFPGAHAFSTNRVISAVFFPATMRAAPTATATGAITYFRDGTAAASSATGLTTTSSGCIVIDITATATSGTSGVVACSRINLSAEL